MLSLFEPCALEMFADSTTGDTSSISAIHVAIRRYWRMCAGIILTAWLLAAAVICLLPTTYEASTQVLLEPLPRKPISVVLDGVADPLDSAQADSRLQVVKSERLLRFVFDTIHWQKLSSTTAAPSSSRLHEWLAEILRSFRRGPVDEKARETQALLDFMNRVSVKRLGLSYVIDISFRAPSARLAASVTNSITAAYLRNLVISSPFEDELLKRRLANVESEKLVLLDAVKKGIIPEQTFPDANARVLSVAIEPLSKSSPKPSLILMMTTVVGISGALFASWSRFRADRTIRTGREWFIPSPLKLLDVFSSEKGHELTDAKGTAIARAKVGYPLMQKLLERQGERYSIVGFAAFGPKSGTTDVVRAVGKQIAEQHMRPTVVDAALSAPIRRPGSCGDDASSRGLLDHVVLCTLPSSDLVCQSKLSDRLKDLSAKGPVLVDLPALSTSFDALAVAPCVDAIVLVANADHTKCEQLAQAIRLLKTTRIVGFVLRDARSKSLEDYWIKFCNRAFDTEDPHLVADTSRLPSPVAPAAARQSAVCR